MKELWAKKGVRIAFIAVLAAILAGTVCVVGVSCGKKKPTTTDTPTTKDTPSEATSSGDETNTPLPEIIFTMTGAENVLIEESGTTFTVSVPNATTILQLHKYVTVPDGVEWIIDTNVAMQTPIISKTVQLDEGSNIFYVCCTDEKNKRRSLGMCH